MFYIYAYDKPDGQLLVLCTAKMGYPFKILLEIGQ